MRAGAGIAYLPGARRLTAGQAAPSESQSRGGLTLALVSGADLAAQLAEANDKKRERDELSAKQEQQIAALQNQVRGIDFICIVDIITLLLVLHCSFFRIRRAM